MPKLRTTVRLTAFRQDEDNVRRLQRYAMRRYTTSWAQRHYKAASMWFTAADRCSRLARMLSA